MNEQKKPMSLEEWEQVAYQQLSSYGFVPNIDCDIYDHPHYEMINATAIRLQADAESLNTLSA